MRLKSDVRPITHLKTKTAELVRQVSDERRPLVITQNGEAKVVVVDVESYDEWRRALALLKVLAMSQADVEAGRLLPQEAAFSRAEATIARAAADG